MRHRIRDSLLGDGVKDDALDRLSLERLFLLEHLQDVPGDRLALAVGVGCQDQLIGLFDRPGDVAQALLRLGVDLPNHAKIGIGLDRTGFGRKVANMAERGQNFVAFAQIFVDRFRLSGRLYQYKIHINLMTFMAFRLFHVEVAACKAAGNMGNAPLPVKSLPVERTAEIVTHCGLIRAADDHTSVHALIVQLSITTSKYTQPPGPKSLTVRLFAAGQPFRVRSRGTDSQGLKWTRQRARKRRISRPNILPRRSLPKSRGAMDSRL